MAVDNPSSLRKLTQSSFGCIGWAIFPFASLLFMANLLRNNGIYETYKYIDSLPMIMFFIGIGLAAFATRKNNLRWIGIGISVSLVFYLVGALIHNVCVDPFIFPFPLSLVSGC